MARYYKQFVKSDELSSRSGWRIFDRQFMTVQGEDLPIAVCRNIHCARILQEALNREPDPVHVTHQAARRRH